MSKEIWFDISEYGYQYPLPVHPDTLKLLLEQAEAMMKQPHVRDNTVYMDVWKDFLQATSIAGDEKWNIMVLLHIAILGLKGEKDPPIIFD